MIKINSLKLKIEHSEEDIRLAAAKKLRTNVKHIKKLTILKKSIDARDKSNIRYVYSIALETDNDKAILQKCGDYNVTAYEPLSRYNIDVFKNCRVEKSFKSRPVIVGFGPAGFTCAYLLAVAGLNPLIIERGEDIDTRTTTVENFWNCTSCLNPESNVQFGEGGAGTFSDGKLNTMIHDSYGRIEAFFDILIKHGAPEEIKYINKPHIGTDKLKGIIKNIRKAIIDLGGEIRFNSKLTDIKLSNGKIKSIIINGTEETECSCLVLAIGHSARDTYEMLYNKGLAMEQKPFAIGVRVSHPQEMINTAQYGSSHKLLPVADYKLTYNNPESQRAVYSFCMCPGGFVVNASSEPGMLCVNGMSYSKRDEYTANSAIVVNISTADFPGEDILSGMQLQRTLEKKAYDLRKGDIPAQYLKDFYKGTETGEFLYDKPNVKGGYAGADLNEILPEYVSGSIKEAFYSFDRSIKGYKYDHAILMGIESRTSSPLRIMRNETYEAVNCENLYPAGEGAGYAGGITSAGVDGLKIAEAIINREKQI